ncbi:DUF3891 family protein [Rossellomorea marisflavi]|uniref:DUF3891 family protein n=1 Tax=Rossellomorea marisflavi TaxID=189381 RepID=UPI0027A349E6|nr:DUF3891 family protein [Rossellomorea marisflavi]UTE73095.1 DUF3891 family protein [Rossellomorea marisflavi]
MIIRETNDSFIMIKQHDHAFLSGEIVRHFDASIIRSNAYWDELLHASYQHDRSWIGLDTTPVWNDAAHRPFTFSDYPLIPKLVFYTRGIDDISEVHPYAGLLCSLHFSSFFTNTSDPDCLRFLEKEALRQTELRKRLPALDEDLLQEHFTLLQFSDDFSLYMCLNHPGVAKDEEHPWFKNGFKHTQYFNHTDDPLKGHWTGHHDIAITGAPFKQPFTVELFYKEVSKSSILHNGVAKAYDSADLSTHSITISSAGPLVMRE